MCPLAASLAWMFRRTGDTVRARARGYIAPGQSGYLVGDELPAGVNWYWPVRNRLEEVCGSVVVLVKSQD